MRFTQGISFRCSDEDGLLELQREWDRRQSTSDVMGYIGARILSDRDDPGHYWLMVEFAEVDGDLTPAQEAERNNVREETTLWFAKFQALVEGEPQWTHFDEIYRTGVTGNLRTERRD